MKLGRIDYLNCYPFYYHMLEKEPLRGVTVYPALPSELNRMMAKKELDMSPVSAAAYADIKQDALLLPDFCISSTGLVKSVILASRFPIEDLGGKALGLTSASRTSVVLLRIILKKFYGVEPVYRAAGPRPSLKDFEAALLIGDDAMTEEIDKAPYRYDLGELWLKKTGLPVVFAVFSVTKAAAGSDPSGVRAVVDSYRASLRCLAEEKQALAAKAALKYPGVTRDINDYLDTLRYEFTDDRKAALKYYFSAASELGLLKEVNALEFVNL
ncbi:MAG: menaquinone biosynthesis protein [Elusimicrobiales bacterium]|nr:menaquinone biosynthesis protein [Elusimicrobiales bacterium]